MAKHHVEMSKNLLTFILGALFGIGLWGVLFVILLILN